jgi:hypothetical protein
MIAKIIGDVAIYCRRFTETEFDYRVEHDKDGLIEEITEYLQEYKQ